MSRRKVMAIKNPIGLPPTLDLSEFHPLTHWAFSWNCWGWAGGPFRHLKFWALYQFQWPWMEMWHDYRCWKGHHDRIPYWVGAPPEDPETDTPMGYTCQWCKWEERRDIPDV